MSSTGQRLRRPYDLALASADFPAWHGPPQRTLLVCTQPRSGSTLLGEAIYFARGLGCPLEYFHPGFRPAFQTRWAANAIQDYVAALHRHRTDPSGVFSVKLFWSDVVEVVRELAPGEFDALPAAGASGIGDRTYHRIFAAIEALLPHSTCIFLTRQDEVRQAISYAVAAQTGSWRKLADTASPAPPVADFHQIVQALSRIQNDNAHWRHFFRANALPCHQIRYEDLATDYDHTLRTAFDALGRPDAPITPPRLRKQGDARSEELCRHFLAEFQRRSRG